MSDFPVVYKQTFKPRASSGTPGLNVSHLQYIATRPGVVKNPECGFGLWGRLSGDPISKNQTDLERAKADIREASQSHTLYRGLVSVGKEDAENFDLYNRETWEALVGRHMKDIAAQMDIPMEHLRWCASMHMKKTHPHVHLIFWDAGNDPRPEYIPPAQFEKKMENIRAAFAGDIHREEIRELQKRQREQGKELRELLNAFVMDTNPAKGLDLDRFVSSNAETELTNLLAELVRTAPQRGSLRFQYLPVAYREKVLNLVRRCLEVPELAHELALYDAANQKVAELYANDIPSVTEAIRKARNKLEKELGNQVCDILRETLAQTRCDAPEEDRDVRQFVREAVGQLVPKLEAYRDLLNIFSGDMTEKTVYKQLWEVQQEALRDNRLLLRLQGYAIKAAGLELDRLPKQSRRDPDGLTQYTLCGRVLTEEQWASYQTEYRKAVGYVRAEIQTLCGQDITRSTIPEENVLPMSVADGLRPALENMASYRELLELLPPERIPAGAMYDQIPGWADGVRNVVNELLYDARFRLPMQSHALHCAGIELDALPDAEPEDEHILFGKALSDEQWEAYQEQYQEEKKELWRLIAQQAREDVGWTQEQLQANISTLLCSILRLVSQSTSQRATGRPLHRSRDKSKEQRRDERAKRQLGSEYEWESF